MYIHWVSYIHILSKIFCMTKWNLGFFLCGDMPQSIWLVGGFIEYHHFYARSYLKARILIIFVTYNFLDYKLL